jgi:hypothetical protein
MSTRHAFRPRRRPPVWLLGGLLVALVALPSPARARTARSATTTSRLTASCKLHVINGLNVPGRFPASLRHLKRRLTAQPFKVFLSFKLLRVATMNLATGRVATAKLAGPYRLEGQLISQVVAGRYQRRLRFELALYRRRTRFRVAKRMLKTTLLLDRGGTFFFVGPPHQGGKLVIGITCR